MRTPGTIRQQIAIYERRIRELEHDLLHATSLLNEDSLTGLLNRRGFAQVCKLLSTGAICSGVPISCAVIDLDDFKAINDRYGHAAGDKALCHFVNILRLNLRPIDNAARLGGDEFALILPEATDADAMDVLNRLLAALAAQPFSTEGGPQVLYFSAGVTEMRDKESVHDQLNRADAILLEAKRGGKRRVLRAS
ncbi:MAG TPA: GGDEF domain-containing protein [Noviherbaspirillum sp.]|jgi:diguanylate cyclase